tara:strand:+ start:9166 stop:9993 length:828 start_codon:yes stop_codon:yes gene_type:complete
MFGQTWSHNTIRKYIILFGTLFDKMYINRENSAGETIQTLKIPLSYGPKEKFLARINMDSNLDRPIATVLPRMSFELITMNYAADRKLNTINKMSKVTTANNEVQYQYSPVPYDFSFQLAIMVKNAEDGTKIIEQILPYFTPEWTATVNLMPDVNGKYDIPIVLNDITTQDSYEGDFTTRRALIHTLTFTMKGYLFGPTRKSKIIKDIDVDIRIPRETTIPLVANTLTANTVVINVKPGMLANGSPTSNASVSVPIGDINAGDDYGFLLDFTENL